MSPYKLISFIFLSLLILLTGCQNASEEFTSYFNVQYKDLKEDKVKANASTQEYINLMLEDKPNESIALLNDTVIPEYETLLGKIEEIELTEADLIKFNNLFRDITEINLNKHLESKKIFETIITASKEDTLDDFNKDKALEPIKRLNEKHLEKNSEQVTLSKKLVEENDELNLDEISPITIDINVINEAYDELIIHFIVNVDEYNSVASLNDYFKVDEKLIQDQGNKEVAFDSQIKVLDDKFILTGRSNLLGGAILNVKSYQYGTDVTYFKGDFQVDQHGDFEFEMDINDEKLDNEPFIVQVAYLPETSDDAEAKSIYGKFGEHLKGPFKHKYTHLKETRYGAFTYAYLELTPGNSVNLAPFKSEIPDDYGDLKIRIEPDKVVTNDNYYDITMKSNLTELTHIDARVTVPDTKVKSNTTVRPDGSFRFRIPRPDAKDIDTKSVVITIEATSEGALETEEIYGQHGEKFKGELVEETTRGKKIVYKLHIDATN